MPPLLVLPYGTVPVVIDSFIDDSFDDTQVHLEILISQVRTVQVQLYGSLSSIIIQLAHYDSLAVCFNAKVFL